MPAMVATSQAAAVDAGVAVLAGGGNAVDAAIAAAAALAVTEPCANGIGGDCFALVFDAPTRAITALNGSGRAPAALSVDRLARDGFGPGGARLPADHAHNVTVPGAVQGWFDLAARHGSWPVAELLIPAIQLARGGFAVGPITAAGWHRGADQLAKSPHRRELLIEDRAPAAGERFTNPTLADALEQIAAGGPAAFYRGAIADAIVSAVTEAGGCLTAADLAAHRSTWDAPIETGYRGLRVVECPPNGQGIAALIALNILSELPPTPAGTFARAHALIEAMRRAFADALRHVADPASTAVPVDALLSRERARAHAASIDPGHATAIVRPPPIAAGGTVYLTTVDARGSACSFIQSNYHGFGTGLVVGGAGFSLQNRGDNFSHEPDHPNAVAPGKRPYHTIMPALALHDDGSLYASFGVMGGFMQPQGQVQVLLAMVDDGDDPQAALDRARLHVDPVSGDVVLERGNPPGLAEKLVDAGHRVTTATTEQTGLFGRGQIIRCGVDGLEGGSDRRADGKVGRVD